MGCVASRIVNDERVQVCKERKKLMKRLVWCRGEFANAKLAYFRALKNTGVTLRQFTESESLELENTGYGCVLARPASLPPSLPPSPPPPPPFSPDSRKVSENKMEEAVHEESIDIPNDDCSTPPPPPLSSSWEFWDPFGNSLPSHCSEKSASLGSVQEEHWAETRSEFGDEDKEQEIVETINGSLLPEKHHQAETLDDNSSTMSWCTKDTGDLPVTVWGKKKTLEGIAKELDDYFLKASAGGKEIAVLLDISSRGFSLPQNGNENKGKRSNSAKVFSALSWSWSSKSLHCTEDTIGCFANDPCKPGAHCYTLQKLYAAEQKLYKEVKEEEITKLEHQRKLALLQKLEDEYHDRSKIDKTCLTIESLETDLRHLRQSISMTCSSILETIDVELYPQLAALTSGLMKMWKMMYKCHRVQNNISLNLNHLSDYQGFDFSTEFHYHATAQLETEVASWHQSFCKLIHAQQEYVRTLCRWIKLTDCLVSDHERSGCSSAVRQLGEEWLLQFERLPDKAASEAIKRLLAAIQAIIQQQAEEHIQQKKSHKLERKLQRELLSLSEMEKKIEGTLVDADADTLTRKHPLSLKRVKTEALRKRVDAEKTRYLNSVEVSNSMTLNNLKTSLPTVFQSLMAYSSASAKAFEVIFGHMRPEVHSNNPPESSEAEEELEKRENLLFSIRV